MTKDELKFLKLTLGYTCNNDSCLMNRCIAGRLIERELKLKHLEEVIPKMTPYNGDPDGA